MKSFMRLLFVMVVTCALVVGVAWFYTVRFITQIEVLLPDIMSDTGSVTTYRDMNYSLSYLGADITLHDVSVLYHDSLSGNKIQFKMPKVSLLVPFVASGKVSVTLPERIQVFSKSGSDLSTLSLLLESPEFAVYLREGVLDEKVLSFSKFRLKSANSSGEVSGGYGYWNYKAIQGVRVFSLNDLKWNEGHEVKELALRHKAFNLKGAEFLGLFAEALTRPLNHENFKRTLVSLATMLEKEGTLPMSELRIVTDNDGWFTVQGNMLMKDGLVQDADAVLATDNGELIIKMIQKTLGKTPIGLTKIMTNLTRKGHVTTIDILVRDGRLMLNDKPISVAPPVKNWIE